MTTMTFTFDHDALGATLGLPLDALSGHHFWPLSELDPVEPPSDTPILIQCPTCHGRGYVNGMFPSDCETCHNTGTVPRETEGG